MPKKKDLALANQVMDIAQTDTTPLDVEILDNDELDFMTMAEYQLEKKKLAEKRKSIALRLDNRKMGQVKKIMDAMDKCMNMILAPGATPMDIQFLTKSYDSLNKTLNTTMRLDTVDGSGKAQRLALEVQFSNGTNVKTVVES